MEGGSKDQAIRWPEKFRPEKSPVFVSNRLTMDVAPERVWAWLVRAVWWPSWYPNSADVRYEEQTSPDLREGTKFQWKTFGLRLRSTVVEHVPTQRLAWTADGFGIQAYHAWLIRPAEGGCEILTEETQHGLLARAGKVLFPRRMERLHQVWLEELRRKARNGSP